MTFLKATKSCLYKYADFDGRAQQTELWWFLTIVAPITVLIWTWFGPHILSFIWGAIVVPPTIAVASRRLHDSGLASTWLLLALFFPLGWLALLVLFMRDSQKGENAYGPDLLSRSPEDLSEHIAWPQLDEEDMQTSSEILEAYGMESIVAPDGSGKIIVPATTMDIELVDIDERDKYDRMIKLWQDELDIEEAKPKFGRDAAKKR